MEELIMSSDADQHVPENFPEKPITIIVGFPPGGSLDLTAQPLAKAVNAKKYLPQPVAVVHHPGEAGTKGMAQLLDAEPDGYTLNLGAMGLLTLQPHLRDLPYDTAADYTPIISLVNNPVCLAVRHDTPWKSINEFIADAKNRPGKIRVGDLGKGSALHLATEQLKLAAGIDLTPAHMSGSPENLEALLDGRVEGVTNHHAVFPTEVAAGRVRILGVFEKKRNPLYPQAETFSEAGYDVTFDSYACMIGPKGLPEPVVSILHDAFKKAMDDSLFSGPMKEKGLDLFYKNPQDLKSILLQDHEANAKVVRAIGLSAA